MSDKSTELNSLDISKIFSDNSYSNYLSFKGIGYVWIYDACLQDEKNFISMKSNVDMPAKLIMLADSLMGVVREGGFSNKNIENLRAALAVLINESRNKDNAND